MPTKRSGVHQTGGTPPTARSTPPPDDGARVGLRRRLPQTTTPRPRPATLAQPLQHDAAPQLTRRPSPDQPRSQPPWAGHLGSGAGGDPGLPCCARLRGGPTGAPPRDLRRGRRAGRRPFARRRTRTSPSAPGPAPARASARRLRGRPASPSSARARPRTSWRSALLFVHVTRTRQCNGTVTASSPRPYPSKLKPLFDESYPATSVTETTRLRASTARNLPGSGLEAATPAASASASTPEWSHAPMSFARPEPSLFSDEHIRPEHDRLRRPRARRRRRSGGRPRAPPARCAAGTASSSGCATCPASWQDLLAFAGLGDVLRVEAGRQAKQREERLGVEEERELDDPGRADTSSTCSAHGS